MAAQALCFINYRRIDGGHAGRLKDRLAGHYASKHIFFDTGSIDCGENFPDAIMHGIQSANVVLAVIGRDWLASLVSNQNENKTDWVKIEIAAALKRKAAGEQITIIPVLVGGATMPDVNHLPDAAQEIAGLFLLGALSLGATDYELDSQFQHLLGLLEQYGMPATLRSIPVAITESTGMLGSSKIDRATQFSLHAFQSFTMLFVSAGTFAFFLAGKAALLVGLILCAPLWIFRRFLMPPRCSANKFRSFLLLLAFGSISTFGFWAKCLNDSVWDSVVGPDLNRFTTVLLGSQVESVPALLMLCFIIAFLLVVSSLLGDRSIVGHHTQEIGDIFPAKTFAGELEAFCKTLADQISKLDRETNWNPAHYAELEAEVEIINDVGMTLRRKSGDMQSAIRADRNTCAFLVLGEPGAGKSVALRKLARDMLAEVGKTGRIPIYVNLREWLPISGQGRRWSELRKPTMDELQSFVVSSITRDDSLMTKFVAQHFDRLREHGHLFFIFDSFDEIPQLLDVDGETWLIESLSDLLYRFIASGQQSRGILASRFFRRPTQSFLAQRILSVKPLTEERILQALSRVPGFSKERQKVLFRDRLDLVPIARNPFLLSLLSEWMQHNGAFPKTQADLYESFLGRCLAQREDLKTNRKLATEDVLRCAKDIAWFVFNSPSYGLEAPVRVIREAGVNKDADEVMGILRAARLARVTDSADKSFSFVHRRFLEYFVTKRLLDHPSAAPLEHIPTDSRGRDSLVLYAQLCDDESANRLALLCWNEIQAHFGESVTRLRAVHCLRFLTEAFRARTKVVNSFSSELAGFIHLHVVKGENLILAKICLEATGLLSYQVALPVLKIAMESNNFWLQETAFRACRHLTSLSSELKRTIVEYIATMPTIQFLTSYRRLIFSLSLSESLKNVRRLAQFRYRNIQATLLIIPLSILLLPRIALFIFSTSFILFFTIYFRELLENAGTKWKKRNFYELNYYYFYFFNFKNISIVWCLSLVVISGILLGQSGSSHGVESIPSTVQFLLKLWRIWDWLPFIVIFGFSIFIIDWIKLFIEAECFLKVRGINSIVVALIWWLFKTLLLFRKGILISAFSIVILIFFQLNENLLIVHQIMEFVKIIGKPIGIILIIVFTARLVFLLWVILGAINEQFYDRRTFRRIDVATQIPRSRIAEDFLALRSARWRLKFVRILSEKKVIATGEWPVGFHLTVSADPAITELAILEERWLKLDR
jgi:TIR domain/NACHT domain